MILLKDCFTRGKNECKMSYLDSVFVVLTSTRDKHFQYLHLFAGQCNIDTTTVSSNQNNLGRVYILRPRILLAFEAIIFF